MDALKGLREKAKDTALAGPLYLMAIGLVVTMLVAMLQESSAQRQRELLFTSEAARVQQEIEAAIDERTNELRSSINFIETTHPGQISEFQDFFAREYEGEELISGDPGVILVEELSAADYAALETREQGIGNESFAVLELSGSTDDKLVITRTARDIDFLGVPLVGVDITDYRESLFPAEIPEAGYALRVIEPDSIMALLQPGPEMVDQFNQEENFQEVFGILVARVVNDDGTEIGWAARFWSISSLLENLNLGDSLNVALSVEGMDLPVLTSLTGPDAIEPGLAELSGRSRVTTAAMEWTIDVWADADFSPGSGFRDQTNILLGGGFISIIGAYGAVWYERSRRKLHEAEFELAHARTLASTDPLTGLFNRQGIVDLARDVPAHRAATVFFVDLDGFKRVNDDDGHDAGDKVLREVSTRLTRIFRATDVVGRIGGDEFVVFTPDAYGANFADQTSKRIIEAVGSVDERVTCSVGVVSRASGEQTDITELIRDADKAMYDAKRAGGDRHAISANA